MVLGYPVKENQNINYPTFDVRTYGKMSISKSKLYNMWYEEVKLPTNYDNEKYATTEEPTFWTLRVGKVKIQINEAQNLFDWIMFHEWITTGFVLRYLQSQIHIEFYSYSNTRLNWNHSKTKYMESPKQIHLFTSIITIGQPNFKGGMTPRSSLHPQVLKSPMTTTSLYMV